jgi:serine/threonine-protein kinase
MTQSEANIRVVETRGDGSSRVGKYHYIAALAQGGMADVYLAVMRGPVDISKLVVVKEMREELTRDPDFVGMFLDEARLASRLNHPNVVQTYEVGNEGNRYFLAMEYLEGIPFVRILRMKERVPVPFAIHARILCDTLAGLHYAHELTDFDGTPLHVVHRDVSPQNILVTFGGGVKVVDFGIAKARIAAERRAGDIKGKLAYMAPEQARGLEIDRRADVFCVGIMLWEAITRRRIWGPQAKPTIEQLLTFDIPDVRRVRPETPARLASICTRALAHDPADRYPTAAEMEADLEDYLSQTGQQTSARDVGRFVAEKFAKDRETLKVAIDTQLKRITQRELEEERTVELPTIAMPLGASEYPPNVRTTTSHPPSSSPSLSPPAVSPSGSPTLTASSTSGVRRRDSVRVEALPPPPLFPEPSVSTAALFAPPQRSKVPLLIAAGLFVASVGMFVASAHLFIRPASSPEKPRASSAAAETISEPPAATATAAPARSAVAPAEAEVQLRVKAAPSSARISIDGSPVIGNPFSGKRPLDGKTHTIRVEAPGHEPKTEEVTFDKDVYISLELHRSTSTGWQAPVVPVAPRTQPLPPAPKPTPTAGKPGIDTDSPYR